jgi:c-di-GMP-binding flagellar brake protein YcgR
MREKVFINSQNIATFICPICKKSRSADVSKLSKADSAININCKCNCGHTFYTTLERRRFFRKDIELSGMFYLGTDYMKLSVTIIDISRSGLKIKLNTSHSFQIGDEILVEFILDDAEKSVVSKKIIVKSINGAILGVEFKSPEHYDKLGSYLMFY